MKILLYGINFYPELVGIGKFSGEMVDWLAKRGHDVRFITAPPYYPEWRIADGYRSWRYQKDHVFGVNVYRCPTWVSGRVTGITRIFHLLSFAVSSLPTLLLQIFWHPAVVLNIEPPLFSASGVLLYARLTRAKAWLHVQDFGVDAAFELNIVKTVRLRKLILNTESWLMHRFDLVSTISERMLATLAAKGVDANARVLFRARTKNRFFN